MNCEGLSGIVAAAYRYGYEENLAKVERVSEIVTSSSEFVERNVKANSKIDGIAAVPRAYDCSWGVWTLADKLCFTWPNGFGTWTFRPVITN